MMIPTIRSFDIRTSFVLSVNLLLNQLIQPWGFKYLPSLIQQSTSLPWLAFSPLCWCPACLMCVLTVILWSWSGLGCPPCPVSANQRPLPCCSDQSEPGSPPAPLSAGQGPRLGREERRPLATGWHQPSSNTGQSDSAVRSDQQTGRRSVDNLGAVTDETRASALRRTLGTPY